MKLKDILMLKDKPAPVLHKKYEDFVNDPDIPINSIEIDPKNGHIISNQLSVLNFIQFLLHEYEYLEERKEDKKFNGKKKLKKKKKLKPPAPDSSIIDSSTPSYYDKSKEFGKLDYYSQ